MICILQCSNCCEDPANPFVNKYYEHLLLTIAMVYTETKFQSPDGCFCLRNPQEITSKLEHNSIGMYVFQVKL